MGGTKVPKLNEMTPTGSEQSPKTREKSAPGGIVPPPVPPSVPILHPEAEELLAIWARLDERARADLMAVARGLATDLAVRIRGEYKGRRVRPTSNPT